MTVSNLNISHQTQTHLLLNQIPKMPPNNSLKPLTWCVCVWQRETRIKNILLSQNLPKNVQEHVTYEYIARAFPQAWVGVSACVGPYSLNFTSYIVNLPPPGSLLARLPWLRAASVSSKAAPLLDSLFWSLSLCLGVKPPWLLLHYFWASLLYYSLLFLYVHTFANILSSNYPMWAMPSVSYWDPD